MSNTKAMCLLDKIGLEYRVTRGDGETPALNAFGETYTGLHEIEYFAKNCSRQGVV